MKFKLYVILVSIFLIGFISFASSSSFGYNYLDNKLEGNVTKYYNVTNVNQTIGGIYITNVTNVTNITQITQVTNVTNNTYINQTVNATVNTTQFSSNSPITLNLTWLTSWISNAFDTVYCKLTGCTMTGNITFSNAGISSVDFIQMNTTYTDGFTEGKLYWNDQDGTLNIGMKGGQVNQQVGQEILLRVKNDQGVQINNGQVVYVDSANAGNMLVKLADADNLSAHKTIGIATEDIGINQHGFITIFGFVRDLNTSLYPDGTEIYLSSIAGEWAPSPPSAPAHTVRLGSVGYSDSTQGTILVNLNLGEDLDRIDDVLITSPLNGQALVYNSTSNLWVNANVTSGNTSFNQSLTDSLYYLKSNPYSYYNSTTLNSTAYLSLNSTGLIKDWNATGYIKDWNNTGLIKNWTYVETDSKAYNGTLAYNSSLANYYPLSNPYAYYNSTTLNTTAYLSLNSTGLIKDWNNTGLIKNWTYTETDRLAYNGTLAYNSSLANYYPLSNPYSYYNSTTLNATAYLVLNSTGLIKDWNATGYIKDWNNTGLIQNYTYVLNGTGLVKNWTYIETDPYLSAQGVAVRDPTGFRDRLTSNLSFNEATRNLTVVGTYPIYLDGVVSNRTRDSIIVDDVVGMHFVYYDDFTGLKQSMSAWGFESTIQVATVYWDGTKAIVGDERHGISMDWQTHEYLHETVSTRYASGLAGSFTDTTFSITSGEYYDEDNEYITGTETTCDLIYRDGSTTKWLDDQTQYYFKNATNMYYDNNGTLTVVPVNQYMAVWVFATNNVDSPIVCMVGQRVDTTIANSRANNVYSSLSFGNMPIPEFKLLYRVIIRNDITPYEETLDERAVSTLQGSNFVATSHGTLSGLNNDDHTQYFLADGSRNLGGNMNATGYNITASNFFGNLNWSYLLNIPSNVVNAITTWLVPDTSNGYLYNDSTKIYFNDTKLNSTIGLEGVRLGFNSTFNSTYNLWTYNQTTAAVNILNGTGLVKDWNSTGYIKDWNATGFIKNWSSVINSYNTTFNQTLTDSLYYLKSNPYAYYNSTTLNSTAYLVLNSTGLIKDWNYSGYIINWSNLINSYNKTFNQTLTDALYAPIKWNYNQTTATVNILNGTGLVKDWNSTGYIKDWSAVINSYNTTFNQTLTDDLYYPKSNPYSYYNSTTLNSTAYLVLNSTGLIKDWNSTGYIKDWNNTGLIKNWTYTETDSLAYNGTLAYNSTFGSYVPYRNMNSDVNMSYYNLTTVRMITFANETNNTANNYNLKITSSSYITSNTNFLAQGSLRTDGDLFSTGSGDDLWLGTSTQNSAKFRAYSNGTLYIGNTTNVTAYILEVGDGGFRNITASNICYSNGTNCNATYLDLNSTGLIQNWNRTGLIQNYTYTLPSYLSNYTTSVNVTTNITNPSTTGLVSYYKLDEGTGNAIDTLGVYNLTQTGTIGNTSGKILSARGDWGSGSGKIFSTTSFQTVGLTKNLTLSAWAKKSTVATAETGHIISVGCGGVNNFKTAIVQNPADETITATIHKSHVGSVDATGYAISADTWYHFVLVYLGNGTARFYVNGNYYSSVTYSNSQTDNACASIGQGLYLSTPDNGEFDNGYVDEASIWNRTLNQTEITALYNSGSGKVYPFYQETTTTTNATLDFGDVVLLAKGFNVHSELFTGDALSLLDNVKPEDSKSATPFTKIDHSTIGGAMEIRNGQVTQSLDKTVAIIMKAIQQLIGKDTSLQSQINALQTENADLKKRLDALEGKALIEAPLIGGETNGTEV